MSSLQIRDLPEPIYEALLRESKRQSRSLAQQAVVILAEGLKVSIDSRHRRKALVEEASTHPLSTKADHLEDPVKLLRKDRER